MLSPKPFRLLIVLAVAAAIALAGCGGGDDEAASPLDEALGHLPEDAGFVFVAATDPDDYGDARKLLDKFPFGGRIQEGLEQGLEQEGTDFDDDIRPLLGNEIVIGVADNASFTDESDDTPYVAAAQARDEGKLRDLVEKGGEEQGSSEGYDLYRAPDGDTFTAVKDDVVVFSDDEDTLKQALKQRGEDDRMTEDDLEGAFEELPEDAPIRGYVNVAALLAADPDTKDALKVKWVDHLETLGFTADVGEGGVVIEQFTRTEADDLADEDLPLPPGDEAPRILEQDGDAAEVVIGLRDPSHVIDFALETLKTVRPADHAQFRAGMEAAGRRLDVDVETDVLDQLSGDATGAVRLDGTFGLRAEVEDAAAFRRTLDKVMGGLPDFADGVRVTPPRGGDGFYSLTTEDGKTYAVGMAGDALVVATDAGFADDVSTRDLVEADGEGALVMSADAEKLANAALERFATGAQAFGGSLFTGPLGALVSSTSATTDGLRGRTELEVD